MVTKLLPTKLLIPPTRPEIVLRLRLINQLDQGFYKPLTLVSAPAGFGKTTLVAEWVKHLQNKGSIKNKPKTAWLSLDDADNDYNRFLAYFIESFLRLNVFEPTHEEEIVRMLQGPTLPPINMILAPLIIALSSLEDKIVLVLEDYHVIEQLAIHQALHFWFEHSPPNVHTVVITREDPPFPLAKLRANSLLSEVRASNLRFTKNEATQFLNNIMNLQLDAESISFLGERTEGWIAGLQMAALSMRDRENKDQFIKNFSGTNRFILDYLLLEVLSNQSEEIQEFLLKTSILKQFTAPLCDAVLGTDNESIRILPYLEQANLFLVLLDNERVWYRYHHLFADLLNTRLNQTHTAKEISELHNRAAKWFENSGMPYGSIYHASLIPDDAWVEKIIDQNYMEVFQQRDSVSIRSWTGELGKELIFRRPQLAIHEANSRAWFGQLDEADQLLDEAEKRLRAEISTSKINAMYGYLAYVRSRVTAMRGNLTLAIQLCLNAEELTPSTNLGLLGGIGVMLGYGYFLSGQFTKASETLQRTIQTGKKFNATNTTIGAYCVLARLFTIQGHVQKAFGVYQEAETFISRTNGEHLGAASIVHVGMAEVFYERNELTKALERIELGLQYLPLWSKADDIALAYTLQAKILLAQEKIMAAQEIMEKATQVIQSSGVFSESRDSVIAEKVLHSILEKDTLSLNRYEKMLNKRLEIKDPFCFENELALISLARIYLAKNQFEKTLDLLQQLENSAKTGKRDGRLIIICILQALILQERSETQSAQTLLERALALAEGEGFIRTFIDEGQPILVLLNQWLALNSDHSLAPYAQEIVSHFEIHREENTSDNQDAFIEPLTKREIEVLTLIAEGKTNKEISTILIVSAGTIKAHTSNIYRKLDVSNRTEAVARGRVLGIIH